MWIEAHVQSIANAAGEHPVAQDAIRETIQQALWQSSYREVRAVTCSFNEGVVVLRGRVSSYFFKQSAQELVRNLKEVDQVVNRVSVCDRQTVSTFV